MSADPNQLAPGWIQNPDGTFSFAPTAAQQAGIKQANGDVVRYGADGQTYTDQSPKGVMDWIGKIAPYGIMAGMGYGALSDAGVLGAAGAAGAGGSGATAGAGAATTAGAGAATQGGLMAGAGTQIGSAVVQGGFNAWGSSKQAKAAQKAAELQTQAANYAADQKAKSDAAALAFQQQQAEATAKQAEIDRKANYDQWAAQQGQHNTVRAALGYPTAPIPAYVPSVDPNFTSAATAPPSGPPPVPTPGGVSAPTGTTPPPAGPGTTTPPTPPTTPTGPTPNPYSVTSYLPMPTAPTTMPTYQPIAGPLPGQPGYQPYSINSYLMGAR